MTHFVAFLFVSIIVSIVFPFMMREDKKERIIFGVKMFAGLLAFAIIVGWIAYLLP